MFKQYLIVGCIMALSYVTFFLIYLVTEEDAVFNYRDILIMFVVIPVLLLLFYPLALTLLSYLIILLLNTF